MTPETRTTAAILLITVATIAFGGLSLLMNLVRRIPGYLDNPVRRALWTAGHAHAGVLVLFALVALLYLDQADYSDSMKTLIRIPAGGRADPDAARLLPLRRPSRPTPDRTS